MDYELAISSLRLKKRIPAEFRSSRTAAKSLLDYIGSNAPDLLALNDIAVMRQWVNPSASRTARVIALTHVGEKQTYDLSVNDGHSYVANGVICHNTTNLPKDIDVSTVQEIYMKAWELGCKGVTIYRKGSRDAVITNELFAQHVAPDRPKKLTCDIHHVAIKGEAWTILIGLMEGKPYEIFGGLSSMIEIPRRHKNGVIVKHTRKTMPSRYDLHIGGGDEEIRIKDIVKVYDNPTDAAFTRTLSLALRHGAAVELVVEQLQKDEKESDMFSFSRVMARVLKGYIPDGTKAGKSVCPTCGGDTLVYTEGCVRCVACAYGKCG